MEAIKCDLKFGVRDNKLIHISDVPSGLACECVCPNCSSRLLAKKGNIREHHFAHHQSDECSHAVETALHLAAKQVIADEMAIRLPPVVASFYPSRRELVLAESKLQRLDDVSCEKRAGAYVPDLIASCRGSQLYIEIVVTNRPSEEKRQWYFAEQKSSLVIDLSKHRRQVTFRSLKQLLIETHDNSNWIYNAKKERAYQATVGKGMLKRTVRRGLALHVDNCPIRARELNGRPYANVIDDCHGCDHCLWIEQDVHMSSLVCDGHLPSNSATK